MSVTVGVVLHPRHRQVIAEAADGIADLALRWAEYTHDADIPEAAAELLRAPLDGMLMGRPTYDACRHLLPDGLPVTILRPAPLSLALAFSAAHAKHLRPPVSIDGFDHDAIAEVTAALNVKSTQVTALPYQPGQPTSEVVDHHLRTVKRSGYVISARIEVANRLRGKLPVVQTQTIPSAIRSELYDLRQRIRARRADEFRFAAGVFLVAEQSRDQDMDRARVGLMNLLVNTPEFADALIENRGRRGLLVLAHKALFDEVTHDWATVPVLDRAEEELAIRVAAGFGIGGSARTCVTLAERAAARAETEGRPSGYLIEHSGVVVGPMSRDGRPAEFTVRDHGPRLEELARSVGLSPATLSRLVSVERRQHGRPLSPSELANALGITDPSGRRLLRKLLAGGLVAPDGSAQTHRKGRPSTLYRLCIETNLDT
ncbi:MAG TPA: hypothetical protein VL652_30215 [Kutzneria sp.]|jgi:hypothetical protein|nr:hypothetical protein [Kutzneria sp.]